MEQIFILSLFLGIALCIAFTVIITFRNYFASDKFIKIKLENFRQDVETLNLENRRLRGAVNRSKREPDLPDSIDDGNIADVAMSLLPKKYHKIAKPLIPKLEEYIANNPEKLEQVLNQIKGVNQSGRKEQADSEALSSL